MSLKINFNCVDNDTLLDGYITIDGSGYEVGSSLNKDMAENNNSGRLSGFNNNQFPNDTKPPIGISSYFSDWGTDIFDSFGYFYLYNDQSDVSGRINLILTNTNSYNDGESVTDNFTFNTDEYNITHGYLTQGVYLLDISCNNLSTNFGFGMFGNLGSDSRTFNRDISSNTYLVEGHSIQFNYFNNYETTPTDDEQFYIYMIPYNANLNKNNAKNYTNHTQPNDNLSIYSNLVSNGLSVIISKEHDVIELLMKVMGYSGYTSVDNALELTLNNQSSKSSYKSFLRTTVYNLFNNARVHPITYSYISNLLNTSRYDESYNRTLRYVY